MNLYLLRRCYDGSDPIIVLADDQSLALKIADDNARHGYYVHETLPKICPCIYKLPLKAIPESPG